MRPSSPSRGAAGADGAASANRGWPQPCPPFIAMAVKKRHAVLLGVAGQRILCGAPKTAEAIVQRCGGFSLTLVTALTRGAQSDSSLGEPGC